MYAGNFLSLTSIYYLFLFRVLRVLYHWSCTNLLRTQLPCPSLCHRKVPPLVVYSSSPSLMGSADPSASHHSIIASHPPPPGRLPASTTRPCEPSVWQKCTPLHLAMTPPPVASAPNCPCSPGPLGLVDSGEGVTCGSPSKPCWATLCTTSAWAPPAHMYTLHVPWLRPLDSAVWAWPWPKSCVSHIIT